MSNEKESLSNNTSKPIATRIGNLSLSEMNIVNNKQVELKIAERKIKDLENSIKIQEEKNEFLHGLGRHTLLQTLVGVLVCSSMQMFVIAAWAIVKFILKLSAETTLQIHKFVREKWKRRSKSYILIITPRHLLIRGCWKK